MALAMMPACFGPLFYSWVHHQFGILGFARILAAFVLAQILIVLVVPESKHHGPNDPVALRRRDLNPLRSFRLVFGSAGLNQQVLSNGSSVSSLVRSLFVIVFFLYTAKVGCQLSLGLYAQQVYNFTSDEAGMLQTTYGSVAALGQMSIAFLLRLMTQKQTVIFGLVCAVTSLALPSIPYISGVCLYFTEAFLALSFVSYTVGAGIVTAIAPKEIVGEASAILTTALAVTEGFGPLMFGSLMRVFLDTPYPGVVFLFFIVCLLAALGYAACLPADAVITASQDLLLPVPSLERRNTTWIVDKRDKDDLSLQNVS
eukprot:gnl/MRDRNA2_/MRDRNA2_125698_c0_seq1.p1 gnl/MRDRNA2_/MRDRNA2_125698_c0~~gnl/MRDRNA2_/MRDRNA2_125698_c0_seq1.p1  ORF type:complete len:314 (+),score=34.78 gnl/MRDRNA2_/MRDRNA2_125698_c0_seq1:1-942(+)